MSYYLISIFVFTAYPTVRTIQTTQQVGNLQRIVNTAQPRHIIGTTQQQVIHHQPTMIGTTQLIRGAQPSTTRVTQPQVIQMTQLQPGENKVSFEPYASLSG